jgi:hypothetical protein
MDSYLLCEFETYFCGGWLVWIFTDFTVAFILGWLMQKTKE